ncbi:hypothetical protein J6590_065911 [Homalodisca vitripennis]|nr:hypothetical protein J6590_065911 [Homalodisca vitripennis]
MSGNSAGLGAGEVRGAVVDAIRCNYRHLDCALVYQNEKEVGEGIQLAIQQGLCKREDLFITTKVILILESD